MSLFMGLVWQDTFLSVARFQIKNGTLKCGEKDKIVYVRGVNSSVYILLHFLNLRCIFWNLITLERIKHTKLSGSFE